MRVRVEVSGMDEIREALKNGGRAVADCVKAALAIKADEVLSLARPLVPVAAEDGGQLAASLRKGTPYYLAASGVVSVAIIAGGKPLEGFLGETHHRYNIYAVLQEFDLGKGAPFAHSSGESHFIEKPVTFVAPSIPDALLAAIPPDALGGQ